MDLSFSTYTRLKCLENNWEMYMRLVDDWDIDFLLHKINSEMFNNNYPEIMKFKRYIIRMPFYGITVGEISELCMTNPAEIINVAKEGPLSHMLNVNVNTPLLKWQQITRVFFSIPSYNAKIVFELLVRFWGHIIEHCEVLIENINAGKLKLNQT